MSHIRLSGRYLAGVCIAGGLTAGLIGCSSGISSQPGARTTSVAAHSVTSDSTITLPLDAYQLSFQQKLVIVRAMSQLADKCVTSFSVPSPTGLDAPVIPRHSDFPGEDLALVHFMSVESAQQYGYLPPPSPQTKEVRSLRIHATSTAFAILTGSLSSYNGKAVPPEGGCIAQAKAELVGSATSGFALTRPSKAQIASDGAVSDGVIAFQNLLGQGAGPMMGFAMLLQQKAAAEMQTDTRLAEAGKRWASCMQHAGFDYVNPSIPQFDRALRANRPMQIQVAMADARCEAQVNYVKTRLALLTYYENKLISSNSVALEAYQNAQKHLLANANAILEGRQPS